MVALNDLTFCGPSGAKESLHEKILWRTDFNGGPRYQIVWRDGTKRLSNISYAGLSEERNCLMFSTYGFLRKIYIEKWKITWENVKKLAHN